MWHVSSRKTTIASICIRTTSIEGIVLVVLSNGNDIFIYQLCCRILFSALLGSQSHLFRSVHRRRLEFFLSYSNANQRHHPSIYSLRFCLFLVDCSATPVQLWMRSFLWIHRKCQARVRMTCLAYAQIVWRKVDQMMRMKFDHLILSNQWSNPVLRRPRDSTFNVFIVHSSPH